MRILTEVLAEFYGSEHKVFAYQAALFTVSKPLITRTSLANIPNIDLALATLYVPPLREADVDIALLDQFGIS